MLNRDNPHFDRAERRGRSKAPAGLSLSFGADPAPTPAAGASTRTRIFARSRPSARPGHRLSPRRAGAPSGAQLAGRAARRQRRRRSIWTPAGRRLAVFGAAAGAASELGSSGGGGAFMLIDESYNANPASMRAAIDTLGAAGRREGRRIAVLGDMLELGPTRPALHAGLADALEHNRVDLVFAAGPLMQPSFRCACRRQARRLGRRRRGAGAAGRARPCAPATSSWSRARTARACMRLSRGLEIRA